MNNFLMWIVENYVENYVEKLKFVTENYKKIKNKGEYYHDCFFYQPVYYNGHYRGNA